jgi:RNA polymerase-binding transcription factor
VGVRIVESSGQVQNAKCQECQKRSGIMATTKIEAPIQRARINRLKQILKDRRSKLAHDLHGRIRDARSDSIKSREGLDEGESSEVDIQDDIEFALIQMKAETLNRIDTALRRIEEGTYGLCFECGGEIAEARLRALPFAVRCKDCEQAHETAEHRERVAAQRHSSSAIAFVLSR